jgi:hypothetical protein
MKKPSATLPPGLRRQADAFVQGGGEVAAEKQPKPATGKKMRSPDKATVAYTLRIAPGKLDALAAVREARAAAQPDRPGSVHSLLLEAVDEFLKNETRRVGKSADNKSSIGKS